MAAERSTAFDIELHYPEGNWVGAGEPMMYITGPFYHLVDLETILLQKLGPACVAAYNAYDDVRRPAQGRPSSPWMRGIAPAQRWPR